MLNDMGSTAIQRRACGERRIVWTIRLPPLVFKHVTRPAPFNSPARDVLAFSCRTSFPFVHDVEFPGLRRGAKGGGSSHGMPMVP